MVCLRSATRQASHTPSSSNAIVALRLSRVWAYSTAEFGRWLEITHRRQYRTSAGSPYLTASGPLSASNAARSTGCGLFTNGIGCESSLSKSSAENRDHAVLVCRLEAGRGRDAK